VVVDVWTTNGNTCQVGSKECEAYGPSQDREGVDSESYLSQDDRKDSVSFRFGF
jgi:hypothetical protein